MLEWEAENRLEVLQQHQEKKQEWQMLNEQNQQLLNSTSIKQELEQPRRIYSFSSINTTNKTSTIKGLWINSWKLGGFKAIGSFDGAVNASEANLLRDYGLPSTVGWFWKQIADKMSQGYLWSNSHLPMFLYTSYATEKQIIALVTCKSLGLNYLEKTRSISSER